MPRKFSYEERKRMLENLENGSTPNDLKSVFKIKDSRTLEKQLVQAREELQLRAARTEIITENLRIHLSEIRSLIELWAKSIETHIPPSSGRHQLNMIKQTEQTRLFEGLRAHLPFPDLWRSYETFKTKSEEYITRCQELHLYIVDYAKKKWDLDLLETPQKPQTRGLTEAFPADIFERAIKVATGNLQAGRPEYKVTPIPQPDYPDLEYASSGAQLIFFSEKANDINNEISLMITELAKFSGVEYLVKLLSELGILETRIHNMTEETLLRRDYILYTCRLCPGGGRSVFT